MVERRSLSDEPWRLRGFLGDEWRSAKAHHADPPPLHHWTAASIPGSVHHDLWRARREPGARRGDAHGTSLALAAPPRGERHRQVTVSRELVDRSDRVFASPRHVRFNEMEYGLPIGAVPEALRRVRRLIDSLLEPPLFPVEVRASAGNDIPLSTAQGRDTGWIAVHQYRGIPYGDNFRGVEAIMDDFGGRPHWGKLHFQNAGTLRPRYPRWDEFADVRAKVDPGGTFRNAYLDRVLGPIDA